jgi:hypothetical protein
MGIFSLTFKISAGVGKFALAFVCARCNLILFSCKILTLLHFKFNILRNCIRNLNFYVMKIELNLTQPLETERITIYNLLKRSEEDLRRSLPELSLLSLNITALPQNWVMGKKILVNHQLSENEDALQLYIKHLPGTPVTNITKELAGEIVKIKQAYY